MSFDPFEHYHEHMRAAANTGQGASLTHGRTRRRPAEKALLVLVIVAGALAFVAGALALAALILVVIA